MTLIPLEKPPKSVHRRLDPAGRTIIMIDPDKPHQMIFAAQRYNFAGVFSFHPPPPPMTQPESSNGPAGMIRRIDDAISHVWMVRTFLKHADESQEDEELREVVRDLYDFCHAVGAKIATDTPEAALKMTRKKIGRLRKASTLYCEIQPEVSGHTNFQMAARSLRLAVEQIDAVLSAALVSSL